MVRGLFTFAKERCPGGIEEISIVERICQYKKNTKKIPIILFDYHASLKLFTTSSKEHACCAGRQKLIREKAKHFFETLTKSLGCKLVFFLDGPIKDHKIPYYTGKTNTAYTELEKFFNVNDGINLKCAPTNMILSIYYDNILEIAKRYGEIHIALYNENDLDIAKYAIENNIFALFASDTDFVVMKGDYQIWIPDTINLNELTVHCLNKSRIREELGLKEDHMPIFATIYGNTIIPYYKFRHLSPTRNQSKIAKMICSTYPKGIRSEDDLNRFARLLYNGGKNGQCMSDALSMVTESLDSYDIAKAQINIIEPAWLQEHIKITNSTIVFAVLNNNFFTINDSIIPLNMPNVNTLKPYSQIILQLVLRQMGVILYNSKDRENIKRKIFYKPTHIQPYKMYSLQPHFPNFNLEQLEHIVEWCNETFIPHSKKIQLLSWLVSPTNKPIDTNILNQIYESVYFIPILILNYFVGEGTFSILEADAILLTISKSIELSVNDLENYSEPNTFPARPFYVSNVYAVSVYYFLNALIVCGLSKCYKGGNFDGFVFHKVYAELVDTETDDNKRNIMMKPLQAYRIYDK